MSAFASLPPWLDRPLAGLEARRARGQLPHAVLVFGPPGVGRRQLAVALACRVLAAPPPAGPVAASGHGGLEAGALPVHPDLVVAEPPPDKRLVPIDRIRQVIACLALTSHAGGAKVALVVPAEAMSHAAANSLLKTLEEPPAGSLIVLVTEAPGRLPATVLSRCERVRVAAPAAADARAWLAAAAPGMAVDAALEAAGGAPFAALELAAAGFVDEAARLAEDLVALRTGRATPLAVARRWAGLPPGPCLRWFYQRVAGEIRARLERPPDPGDGSLQNAGEIMSIRGWFHCLDEVAELRRLAGAGLNMELGLARLLALWAP